MNLQVALQNAIPSMPKVLTNIISEYGTRRYKKIEEAGFWQKLWTNLKDSPLISELQNENIEQAIDAIRKYGWSDSLKSNKEEKGVYHQILPLIQQEKWKSVEFIFAQLMDVDLDIMGFPGTYGESQLCLGLPPSYLEYISDSHFDNTIWSTLGTQKSIFEDNPNNFIDKTFTINQTYFKILEIWLTYHPLIAFNQDFPFTGSFLFEAAIKGNSPDYRIVKIFFQTDLQPKTCWISHRFHKRIHLAAWSILTQNSVPNRSSTEMKVSAWLDAGLNPNTFIIDDEKDHRLSWLMAMVCNRNLKGVELLLQAGADPNLLSKPLDKRASAHLTLEEDSLYLTPLIYARSDGRPHWNNSPMIELLKRYGAK